MPGRLGGLPRYLISALAPASSSFFLTLSASSLVTPSFTALGALSTNAFASVRPRLVELAHGLDDFDLLGTNFGENDVKLGLLRLGRCRAGCGGHHRHRRRGRNAIFLFELLDEIGELETVSLSICSMSSVTAMVR